MPRTLLPTFSLHRAAMMLMLLTVVFGGSGCTPRDPLDREVEGRTLAELRSWTIKIKREVDPELAQEIDLVFVNLAANTPRFVRPQNERDLHARGNALCRRVDGRPLREVMIDSYEAANTALALQNNIDAQNLLRLSGVVNVDRIDAFERRADFVKEEMARRDEQIQRNRERIEQLRKPAE